LFHSAQVGTLWDTTSSFPFVLGFGYLWFKENLIHSRTILILPELYQILCKKLHFCIAWKIIDPNLKECQLCNRG
jgi:hypothetical protein